MKKIVLDNCVAYRNDQGLYHREDGPAIEWFNGSKAWYVNGKCHREDGPAIMLYDGSIFWWFDDKIYEFEEWEQLVKFKAFI